MEENAQLLAGFKTKPQKDFAVHLNFSMDRGIKHCGDAWGQESNCAGKQCAEQQ